MCILLQLFQVKYLQVKYSEFDLDYLLADVFWQHLVAGAQKHQTAVEHTLVGQVSHGPYHDCNQWLFHLLAPDQNIASSVFKIKANTLRERVATHVDSYPTRPVQLTSSPWPQACN